MKFEIGSVQWTDDTMSEYQLRRWRGYTLDLVKHTFASTSVDNVAQMNARWREVSGDNGGHVECNIEWPRFIGREVYRFVNNHYDAEKFFVFNPDERRKGPRVLFVKPVLRFRVRG